ncbi:MAG: hypothetical protein K2Y20_07385 [Sphingomonas sp.]|nr:hypothetical protein [Sphingomonas sp.]
MHMRRTAIAVIALLLLAVTAVRHPSADIRVIAHQVGDPAPRQVTAAIDLGVMAFSLLITWTGKRFS